MEWEVRPVGVADMLRARDERAQRQQTFLRRYGAPLISLTMNIAGSIKNDALIRRAFEEGVRRISIQLKGNAWETLDFVQTVTATGCEALWAVQADAAELKQAMRLVEESDALGRLFDADVIAPDGAHLSRETERACLICCGPVRACARSRAHSAEELFAKVHEIMEAHFQERYAKYVGELAQKALLIEAVITPKPGLVDCENSGSHRDMDLFSFIGSACALRGYFEDCARLGMQHAEIARLRATGMEAEAQMLAAARANTHKGAIFSLGILCYAAGSCGENAGLEVVLQKAAELGDSFLQRLKANDRPRTAGERQYAQYGLTGVRGEAASGFQTVRELALPIFRKAMRERRGLNAAGLETLLHLIAHVQDSNLIHRAGMDGQRWAAEQARAVTERVYTADDLREMNRQFVKRNASPGGSADLLAATVFLFLLEESAQEGEG